MSTQLLEDLGLDTASPDADQQQIDSHGCAPEGRYHARLIECADDMVGSDGYRVKRMKFQLLAKPYAGKEVKFDLFMPHDGDSEKKAKAQAHCRMWYHRLGVLKSADLGNGKKKYDLADPNKPDLRDYLGAECFIDVLVEEREFIGKKGDKVKFKENKAANYGVYALNDPKCKDVKRGDGSAPPPAAKQPEVNLDGI